ncbi:hypothetical protein BKI51_07030 [Alphaproteobacteria bacterium AO1-B]|nr:helix-turn-helix domain-containing protein [Labrenzia sp. R4_1]OJJ12376.1 hypothetical protein BKI51_07030 [Alphaproteobacteria bacterium AO1-B]
MIGSNRKTSPIPPDRCNLAAAFELIGDRPSLLVLRSIFYGVTRFNDIQFENGIARTVLSDRLKRLCANGLLVKQKYNPPTGRSQDEYVPTQKAIGLLPAFVALTQWFDRWGERDGDPPITFVDKTSEAPVRIAFVNEQDQAVSLDEIKPIFS